MQYRIYLKVITIVYDMVAIEEVLETEMATIGCIAS